MEITSSTVNQDFAALSKLTVDSILTGMNTVNGLTKSLTSHCLFMSNNLLSIDEMMRSHEPTEWKKLPVKPTFATEHELITTLEYFLSKDDKRHHSITVMRDALMKQLGLHGSKDSQHREELMDVLSHSFGIKPVTKPQETSIAMPMTHNHQHHDIGHDHNHGHTKSRSLRHRRRLHPLADTVTNHSQSLCVGIRTSPSSVGGVPSVMSLIRNMANQFQKLSSLSIPPLRSLRMFVVDTESNANYTKTLMDSLSKFTKDSSFSKKVMADIMIDQQLVTNSAFEMKEKEGASSIKITHKEFNAIHMTGRLLELLLSTGNDQCSTGQITLPTCDWVMVTNSANEYQPNWLQTVSAEGFSTKSEIIAWDFTMQNVMVKSAESVGFSFDRPDRFALGSMMIRSSLLIKSQTKFLSDSIFSSTLNKARDVDWLFAHEILQSIKMKSEIATFIRKALSTHVYSPL